MLIGAIGMAAFAAGDACFEHQCTPHFSPVLMLTAKVMWFICFAPYSFFHSINAIPGNILEFIPANSALASLALVIAWKLATANRRRRVT